MEVVANDVDGVERGVADHQSFGVGVRVDLRANGQASARGGVGDQLHDDLVADERTAAPVHRDEREQAMLDLVPFARARWEVAYPDGQPRFLRQPTQLELPKPHPRSIAAPAVSCNRQLARPRVARATHDEPPAPDGLHGKSRGVVIGSHADPALVGSDVVHTVWAGAAEFVVHEVVHSHLLWLSLRMPFTPAVLVLPDKLLFLRVHGDHRLSIRKGSLDGGVDVFELRVAVGALVALDHLGVALKAVALGLEQLSHQDVAGSVADALEFIGQDTQALATPAQGRLRITACRRIHQRQQVRHQAGILQRRRLTSATAAAHRTHSRRLNPAHEFVVRRIELLQPSTDGVSRQPRCSSHLCHPATSDHPRLGRRQDSSLSLVQMLSHQFPTLSDRRFILHQPQA